MDKWIVKLENAEAGNSKGSLIPSIEASHGILGKENFS